jgi:hypothetical protein
MRFLLLFLLPLVLLGQTRSVINTGATANDGTGDSARTAFNKVNTNFATLWAVIYTNQVGTTNAFRFSTNAFLTSGTNVSLNHEITITNKLTFDGNLTNDLELEDIATLTLDSTDLGLYGVASVYLDGGDTTIRAITNLHVVTPAVYAGTASTGQVLRLTDDSTGEVEFASAPSPTGFTFDAARNNILLGDDNAIVDTNPVTINVTLTGAGGTSPNRIGTSTHTTTAAGTVSSGVIISGRPYYVSGTTGTVTYNAVAYSPGATFYGVYGVLTYSATGDCIVKDPVTRLPDSSYVNGQGYVATISGGYDHLNNQIAGTIAGGGHNELRSGGNHATIVGGSYNVQKAGLYSFIGGGTQNHQSQDFGNIVGGWGNTIHSDNVAGTDYSFIGGGTANRITDASTATILNGQNNYITNSASITPSLVDHNQILNGLGNGIDGSQHTTILNGSSVLMSGTGSFYNTILNGSSITVSGTTAHALIQGSTITVDSLSRGIIYGDLLTVGSGTHNSLIGQSGVMSGGQFNLNWGLSNVTTNTPTRTLAFGTANVITNTSTDVHLFGNSHQSLGATYSDSFGFANVLGASSAYSLLAGNGNTTTNGATYMFVHGLANASGASDYGAILGRSSQIVDQTDVATQANYAMAQGYEARARSFGQRAESNGDNTGINVQRSRYVASRRYTHATGVLSSDLRLDGSGQYIYVPTNSVWQITANVVGVQSDGVKYGTWKVDFAVRDSAGTLSVLGSPSATVVHNGHSTTWTIAPSIRSSPRGVTISVTALDGETITWGASLDAMELNGAW